MSDSPREEEQEKEEYQDNNERSKSRSKSPKRESKSRSRSRSRSREREKSDEEMKRKLYVGNLAWSVDDHYLRSVFEAYGKVSDAFVLMDGGRSRGCAFVTFNDEDDAKNAQDKLNDTEIEGRPVKISFARPRGDGPPRRYNRGGRSGGYGGGRNSYGGGGRRGGYGGDRDRGDRDRGDRYGGGGGHERYYDRRR